jgi:hypothetical protein
MLQSNTVASQVTSEVKGTCGSTGRGPNLTHYCHNNEEDDKEDDKPSDDDKPLNNAQNKSINDNKSLSEDDNHRPLVADNRNNATDEGSWSRRNGRWNNQARVKMMGMTETMILAPVTGTLDRKTSQASPTECLYGQQKTLDD